MANTTGHPDGMRVQLLQAKDQHGNTRDAGGKLMVSKHGAVGDIVTLSWAVANDLHQLRPSGRVLAA